MKKKNNKKQQKRNTYSGSAVHAKKWVTSLAICEMVAGVPSSNLEKNKLKKKKTKRNKFSHSIMPSERACVMAMAPPGK